jgi:hypothetical protein
MAKKFQTDGNLLHHDHQHPFQPNADSSHPSISSGTSTTQPNRSVTNSRKAFAQDSIDYIPPELSLDDHHPSDNDDDENPGEHMTYIEKHVEFTDGLTPDDYTKESNQQQKLHRRDTPHHLKNKRIINKNNDSITLDQIMSHSPTKSSIASAGKEVREKSID